MAKMTGRDMSDGKSTGDMSGVAKITGRDMSGVAKMTRRDMSGGKTTGGDMSGVVKVCKGICPEPPPKMTGGGLSWRGFVQSGKNDRRRFVRSGKNDMGGCPEWQK